MGTSTTDPYHDAAWESYMETERAQLAQRASGQMRRAIGGVLKGESEENLERIAKEDQRLAQEGMVPLRREGRVYCKHIDDLTREDVGTRLEAKWVTAMWLKGRIEGERIAAQLREKGWDQPDAHTS
jgi:hypothetical protein